MPRDRYPPHDLGRIGEEIAARTLEAKGWRVVARSERWGRREIDLVARRGPVLAFVEVKTRSGTGFGAPEEAVTPKKRREIERVARRYLARRLVRDLEVRFDVVAVVVDRWGRPTAVRHIEDAWRPGE